MKRKIWLFLIVFIVLAFTSCSNTSSTPSSAKLPTPEPTETPSAAPTLAPAIGTEVSSDPIARQIELPEDFHPQWKPEYEVDPFYTEYAADFDNVSYSIRMGEIEMAMIIRAGKDSRVLYYGVCAEPFEGVIEDGLFICSEIGGVNTDQALLPRDHLFFIDAKTGGAEDLGDALHYCVQTDSCLVGAAVVKTAENGENISIRRFDIISHETCELCSFGSEEPNLLFYGKWFSGEDVYFTFLRDLDSTDFGIYRLNYRTGECIKVASHGLPYALDEDGILLYGDYSGN